MTSLTTSPNDVHFHGRPLSLSYHGVSYSSPFSSLPCSMCRSSASTEWVRRSFSSLRDCQSRRKELSHYTGTIRLLVQTHVQLYVKKSLYPRKPHLWIQNSLIGSFRNAGLLKLPIHVIFCPKTTDAQDVACDFLTLEKHHAS